VLGASGRQTISASSTVPSESAVPRWMQRSENARAVPSESRQSTSGSSSRRVATGSRSRSSPNATGCQHRRSAGCRPTAEGETISPMLLATALAAALIGSTHAVGNDAQFEAAVSALRDSGGTIVLGAHDYGDLVVGARGPRPLRIVGTRGTRVERLLFDHTQQVSAGGFTVAPQGQDAWIQVDASTHVDLHDLHVTAQGTDHVASVVVPDSTDVTIRRSTFSHCGDRSAAWSNCLLLWRWSHRVTVEDDWFHDCYGCDFVHGRFGSDLTIRRNRFERALPCRIGRVRCEHQDLIELFAGRGLRVEDNHFGVYERGGAQLYVTGATDHVRIVNNVFVGTDPRVPGYHSRIGIVVGSKGAKRLGLPLDVEVVNNTILTGARRRDGYLGSVRINSRYRALPWRLRPLFANNVLGFLERRWPVCKASRLSVSNVVLRGEKCSPSDVVGAADLDAHGRPTAESILLIDQANRRYAPAARSRAGHRRLRVPGVAA
jgi:Right handed beta helix region